jgi:hypothetical protein
VTFFGGRVGLQALIIFPRIGLIYSIYVQYRSGPRVLSVPLYSLFKGTVQRDFFTFNNFISRL